MLCSWPIWKISKCSVGENLSGISCVGQKLSDYQVNSGPIVIFFTFRPNIGSQIGRKPNSYMRWKEFFENPENHFINAQFRSLFVRLNTYYISVNTLWDRSADMKSFILDFIGNFTNITLYYMLVVKFSDINLAVLCIYFTGNIIKIRI